MLVTILFLASYREMSGTSRISLALPAGATIAEMLALVCARYTDLPDSDRIVVAVNNEYQDGSFVLDDGDEVALIPPVSGG